MPLSSYCRNCGRQKSMEFYAENYCEFCTEAINKAKDDAIKSGQNPFDAQRSALAQRAHDTRNNRPDPRFPFSKSDYWEASNPRLNPSTRD